jgi:PhnB protein
MEETLMDTNLNLVFPGTCDEAFTFYEKVLGTKRRFRMTYGEAPEGSPVPDTAKDLIMHTAMQLGSLILMGCDAPPGREQALGGFQIALNVTDEAEVRRIFAELSEDGSVLMPAAPTFWSPLFGMLTDKFGVGWMVGIPGPVV